MAVRLYVDQDLCISCGACVGICPEVFDWNDDEKAHVIVDPVPEDLEDDALEAQESCPTEAILDKE
ncbi:MAG: ferredoxin [Firmicutes bacterium]|nr:ferredoxin [Bacillota bacterium]